MDDEFCGVPDERQQDHGCQGSGPFRFGEAKGFSESPIEA